MIERLSGFDVVYCDSIEDLKTLDSKIVDNT